MTTIGLSSSPDRTSANAKKPSPRDDDDAPRPPRSLLSNRPPPPRPFCPPPQKRLLFHPPTQKSLFKVFFKGSPPRRQFDSNPIAPNLPLLLLLLLLLALKFALVLLLVVVVDAGHPLIVVIETSMYSHKVFPWCLFCCTFVFLSFSLSLATKNTLERYRCFAQKRGGRRQHFFILMFRVYMCLSKP